MNDFGRVIKELICVFKELTEMESRMLQAAEQKRAAMIEEYMIKEQAVVMQLRGLEKEKDRVQAAAGYEGMTFRDILNRCEADEKSILLPLFDELSRAVQIFQEVHEDTVMLIELNLRQIKRISEQATGQIYSDGREDISAGFRHMTNKRV